MSYEYNEAELMQAIEEAQARAEETEQTSPRRYIFGLNVKHTNELATMGDDMKAFMEKLGEGDVEIQVMVNPKMAEPDEELEPVMGFHSFDPPMDYYEDDDEEEDE